MPEGLSTSARQLLKLCATPECEGTIQAKFRGLGWCNACFRQLLEERDPRDALLKIPQHEMVLDGIEMLWDQIHCIADAAGLVAIERRLLEDLAGALLDIPRMPTYREFVEGVGEGVAEWLRKADSDDPQWKHAKHMVCEAILTAPILPNGDQWRDRIKLLGEAGRF